MTKKKTLHSLHLQNFKGYKRFEITDEIKARAKKEYEKSDKTALLKAIKPLIIKDLIL